jgi:hypothetical protein
VSPRTVLAELVQELASELATFFDELPMTCFWGRVSRVRAGAPWRWLVPARRVQHRVVLARYVSATVPWRSGVGYTGTLARIAVLAIGADGELRAGIITEQVNLPESTEIITDPLAWDDMRIRRVPSRSMTLTRWYGRAEPHEAASPGRVLEALTSIAATVARESRRDLALLQRFL